MFKKVMVCTDLSPASDALIECAGDLKSVGTEEVVLAHVIYVANTPGFEEMLLEQAKPALERQKRVLEDQGLRVSVETPTGLPAVTLDSTAQELEASVILIGSHGKGIFQKAVLGSISSKLLHLTRCPVLLARIALFEDGRCDRVCRRIFTKVLFPTDFSESAERALDYLGKIALETRCQVELVHVIEEVAADAAGVRRQEEDVRFLLEAKKRRLQVLGAAEVTVDLAIGSPAEKILTHSREGGFSAIVLGSQGKAAMKELIFGSVANEVARHATVPVLFVPAQL